MLQVVENRVQMLTEVGELDITEKSEVATLIGALTVSTESVFPIPIVILHNLHKSHIFSNLSFGVQISLFYLGQILVV